jgi:hypothetical protein
MQAYRRVFAIAIAASGSSKAPGHGDDRHGVARHVRRLQLLERALEQAARDLAVELGDDDAHGAATPFRRPGQHLVAGRNLEPARCVLDLLFVGLGLLDDRLDSVFERLAHESNRKS